MSKVSVHDEPPTIPQPELQVPAEEIAFERNKRRMAVAFLLVVTLMLVVCAILVYVVLRNRPDTATSAVVGAEVDSLR